MNKKIKTQFTARQILCLSKTFDVELVQTPEGHYTRESLLAATRYIRNTLNVRGKDCLWTQADVDNAVPVRQGDQPFVFGGDGSDIEIISDCDEDLLDMFYEELKDEQPA